MRLLKYAIALLFLVILAESIYLLFFKSSSIMAPAKMQPATTSQNINSNQEANTSENWDNINSIDTLYNNINPNMAIDPKVIYSHIFYKKGITTSSIIQNVHSGIISEIDRSRKKAFYSYYDAALTIRLVSSENPDLGITLNFSDDDLSKMTVTKMTNRQETNIDISDLSVGDSIKIEDSIDAVYSIPNENAEKDGFLTKSWGSNRIKTHITKLN